MTSTLRFGRLAGVKIGANWTWLLVVGFAVWTLGSVVFPDQNPGLAQGTYWTMAAVAAGLLFLSVVLHELGHALQARREGVEIEGITLWLLGGVAKLRGTYASGAAEFRVAAAGPLVTAVLAAVLVGVGTGVALPAAVDGVVAWLGYVNTVILVFNLLPAVPLDGGRLLHAALWHFRGDRTAATRIASGIARGIGFALIAIGVLTLFAGAGVGAAWIVLVGWFIGAAAGAEAEQQRVLDALEGVQVADLMASDVVTVAPATTVGRFMDEVARRTRFTSYPVVDDGAPVGLVTFRCVADVPRAEWELRQIRSCMRPLGDVPVVAPGDDAAAIVPLLVSDHGSRALVMERGALVGILSITDVARAAEVARGRGGARPR